MQWGIRVGQFLGLLQSGLTRKREARPDSVIHCISSFQDLGIKERAVVLGCRLVGKFLLPKMGSLLGKEFKKPSLCFNLPTSVWEDLIVFVEWGRSLYLASSLALEGGS